MAISKINPFGKAIVERSAIDILQENFGIGVRKFDRGHDRWSSVENKWIYEPSESLECVIEFAVNEGKGTGRQCIPADEFRDYVAVLQDIVSSDFAEDAGPDRTEYIPTHTVARQSFKMVRPRVIGADGKIEESHTGDRNVVSVRCTTGKGAKPMFVNKEEFVKVVQILSGIADNLDEYEKQAWSNYQGN